MGIGCSYYAPVEVKYLWFRRIVNPNNPLSRHSTRSLHQAIIPANALIADIAQDLSQLWGFEILEIYEDDGNSRPNFNKPVNISARAENFFENSREDHPIWFIANDDAFLMSKHSSQHGSQTSNGGKRGSSKDSNGGEQKVTDSNVSGGTFHVKA